MEAIQRDTNNQDTNNYFDKNKIKQKAKHSVKPVSISLGMMAAEIALFFALNQLLQLNILNLIPGNQYANFAIMAGLAFLNLIAAAIFTMHSVKKSEKFEIIKESVEDSLFLYLKTDYYGFDKDVTGNNLLKINEFTIKDNLNKENLQIKINSNFFDYNQSSSSYSIKNEIEKFIFITEKAVCNIDDQKVRLLNQLYRTYQNCLLSKTLQELEKIDYTKLVDEKNNVNQTFNFILDNIKEQFFIKNKFFDYVSGANNDDLETMINNFRTSLKFEEIKGIIEKEIQKTL